MNESNEELLERLAEMVEWALEINKNDIIHRQYAMEPCDVDLLKKACYRGLIDDDQRLRG